MDLSVPMDQESRRLLDYARTSFERLMLRSVMFLGGVLISAVYLDWLIALVGFVVCYGFDHVEMKTCRALMKARDLLPNSPDLRTKLRNRLSLSALSNTFVTVLFVVVVSLRGPEDLRLIPVMFLISAALYWTISHPQIAEIVRARAIIIGSGVTVILAVPMMTSPAGINLMLLPKTLTTGSVFYFIYICSRAYTAGYNRSLDQIMAVERSLNEVAQSDENKSDLLRILSHELRTPLNGVLGMAQLLSLGQLTAQQRSQLATITESGNRLDALVNEVMDSEHLNTGRIRIIKEPVCLSSFISPIIDRHCEAANKKGVSFEVETLDDLPDQVVIDAGRVEQCLDHLISNAIKFTDHGYVKVGCTHTAHPGPPRLTFCVQDTGIGMSKDAQARIFQRFAQEDMSESRSYGGMGLGLWISNIMAELMGGGISVDSSPGAGSTFTLNLIAEEVTTEKASAGSAQGASQAVNLAS